MRKLLFLILTLCTLSVPLVAQDIYFDHIPTTTPIGNIVKNGISQDKNGQIWIGTRQGLFSYDGVQLKKHSPYQNQGDEKWVGLITMLCSGADGNMYMLTNWDLTIFNTTSESFKSFSNYQFTALAPGKKNVWAAAHNQIFLCDGEELTPFLNFPPEVSITFLYESNEEQLYVGTNKSGVHIVDRNKKITKLLDVTSSISVIKEDTARNLWIGTWNDGLYQVDNKMKVFNFRYNPSGNSISGNHVRDFCEDDFGNLWIGTMNGLDRLSANYFTHYGQERAGVFGLTNSSVWSVFRDRQGTIWLGTYFGGIYRFNPQYENYFYHLISNPQYNQQYLLSQIIKDRNGNYWIASEGNGLMSFNRKNNTIRWFKSRPNDPYSLSHNNIKYLYYDEVTNELWICTHMGGICRMNITTERFQQIQDPTFPHLSQGVFRAMVRYGNRYIVATHEGLYYLDPRTLRFSLLRENKSAEHATTLLMTDDHTLWVGAEKGFVIIDLKTGQERNINISKEVERDLSSYRATCLFKDSKGNIWFGTETRGLDLFNPKTNAFEPFSPQKQGSFCSSVFSIQESHNGYLLVATECGLTQIDIENHRWYNHNLSNGFPLQSMNPGGIFCEPDGLLLLSGNNGMVSIYADKLLQTPKHFELRFASLSINNQPVSPGDSHKILKKTLAETQSIKLHHNQSIIQIHFACDNYIKSVELRYQYRLDGFDKDWKDASADREITYMNLSPGSYTLRVQAFNPFAIENSVEKELKITVLPPFYKTWWAYLLYFIIIALVVRWLITFYSSKIHLETSLFVERKEKEQIEAANQSKLRFFTNISHEFRTPITLILGQLQMLMESTSIQPSLYNRVLTIYKNATKMQDLITELLDFRKQEQGFLKLRISEQNLINFSYEIFTTFKEYANIRQISFSFSSEETELPVWIDTIQFQKVLNNLISNAFKYTEKGGSISVTVNRGEKSAFIHIADTGIGISKENLERIFDRFYQVENISASLSVGPGTGIGLSLAKGIIEAHGGNISLKTEERVGSIFTVEIPFGDQHFANNTSVSKVEIPNADQTCVEEIRQELTTREQSADVVFPKDTQILIVEDNEELRTLLSDLFITFATVSTAENGEDGYEKARTLQPDLIISDVMMPVMSGNEMCARIKANYETSHIPVVLLTACTTAEQTIEGLRTGADDYIVKPFNMQMLLTRCHNLIQNKRAMREKYCRQIDSTPNVITTSNLDQQFLEDAIRIVEDNLQNESFDVKIFAREMRMGLTNFYAKLKGITGQTPNDFILMIRLRKAASVILEDPTMNISEIGYQYGFCNPKYFSRCFKQQFGMTPSAFKKNAEEQAEQKST